MCGPISHFLKQFGNSSTIMGIYNFWRIWVKFDKAAKILEFDENFRILENINWSLCLLKFAESKQPSPPGQNFTRHLFLATQFISSTSSTKLKKRSKAAFITYFTKMLSFLSFDRCYMILQCNVHSIYISAASRKDFVL